MVPYGNHMWQRKLGGINNNHMSYLKKNWYESKTLWLNIVAILSGILVCVQEFLANGDTSATGITMLVIGILNFINRFFTTQGLE